MAARQSGQAIRQTDRCYPKFICERGGQHACGRKFRRTGAVDSKGYANRSGAGVRAASNNRNGYVRLFLCVKLCFDTASQVGRIGRLMKKIEEKKTAELLKISLSESPRDTCLRRMREIDNG